MYRLAASGPLCVLPSMQVHALQGANQVSQSDWETHSTWTVAGGTVGVGAVQGDTVVSSTPTRPTEDFVGSPSVGPTAARWSTRGSPVLAHVLSPAMTELGLQRPQCSRCACSCATLPGSAAKLRRWLFWCVSVSVIHTRRDGLKERCPMWRRVCW